MELKHTKGPWRAVQNGVCNSSVQSGDGTWITRDAGEELSCDEAEANARLIAASPELLEFAMLFIERNGMDETWMTSKARAAIAKATGAQA